MEEQSKLNKASIYWLILLIILGVCAAIFTYDEERQVCNILPIEFSANYETFYDLTKDIPEKLIANTEFDFLFIIVYTIFFLVSYRIMYLSLQSKSRKIFIVLCLLPGLLDIGENIFILSFLANEPGANLFQWYKIIVRLKWLTLIPMFLIILTIVLYYAFNFVGWFFGLFIDSNSNKLKEADN